MANHHFIMTEKTLLCTDCEFEVDEEVDELDKSNDTETNNNTL